MTREQVELRFRNWLWWRWEAACEEHRKGRMMQSEVDRALSEAESGNWAGPLKLRDGTELPEHTTMPRLPQAMKRERTNDA